MAEEVDKKSLLFIFLFSCRSRPLTTTPFEHKSCSHITQLVYIYRPSPLPRSFSNPPGCIFPSVNSSFNASNGEPRLAFNREHGSWVLVA